MQRTNLFGGVHDQLALDGGESLLLVVGEHLVAGGQERVQVGDGASYRKREQSREKGWVSGTSPSTLPQWAGQNYGLVSTSRVVE